MYRHFDYLTHRAVWACPNRTRYEPWLIRGLLCLQLMHTHIPHLDDNAKHDTWVQWYQRVGSWEIDVGHSEHGNRQRQAYIKLYTYYYCVLCTNNTPWPYKWCHTSLLVTALLQQAYTAVHLGWIHYNYVARWVQGSEREVGEGGEGRGGRRGRRGRRGW